MLKKSKFYVPTDEDCEVVDAMELYGGSFVKALATCFLLADGYNYPKLKEAFFDYWLQYQKIAKEKKQ